MSYRFSAQTDTGRRREANEDALLAPLALPWADGTECVLAAVADGVGGAVGGAVASTTGITRFRDTFLSSSGEDPAERLQQAILEANTAILERGTNDAAVRGMATTLVGAAVIDRRIWFVNVGDSRAYLLQDDRLYQVTTDHSLVADAVRAGVLTPEEAAVRPERHVITRSLGQAPGLTVDVHGPLRFASGDIALLCSDGLHDAVSDEAILEVLRRVPVDRAADELVRLANDAGGPDNISIVVLANV